MKFPLLLRTAFALGVAVVAASLVRAGDIKVQSDRWMPLNGTPQENPPGYAIELLVDIFTDTDTVTYTLEPWADSLDSAAKGKSHAVIGAARDEAPTLVYPQESIARIDSGLWAKKGSAFTYSPAALAKAKIGVVKGYTYWPEVDALVQAKASNIRVFEGNNPLVDALAALARGEIDLLPESRAVFLWTLRETHQAAADFELKFQRDGEFVYVAFTPSTRGRELAAKWDAGIAARRKDGTLAKILAKYGVADWAGR